MNACSYSSRTCSSAPSRRFGSAIARSGAPARSSSQFGPHWRSSGLPVTCDSGRATGWCFCTGAVVSVS